MEIARFSGWIGEEGRKLQSLGYFTINLKVSASLRLPEVPMIAIVLSPGGVPCFGGGPELVPPPLEEFISLMPLLIPNHLQHCAGIRSQFFRSSPRSMENHPGGGQAVVRHFKPSRTIGLHVRKTMHKPLSSANIHFNSCASCVGALQFPVELSCIAHAFAEFAEGVLFPVVPKHCRAGHHAERHLIRQRLKRGAVARGVRKMDVRPAPQMAVPVSPIVPLTPLPQKPPAERAMSSRQLARKQRNPTY